MSAPKKRMRKTVVLTVLLLVLPLFIILYKVKVLNLSLIPHFSDDSWEIYITAQNKKKIRTLSFPVPLEGQYMSVQGEKFDKKSAKHTVVTQSDSKVVSWYSSDYILEPIEYSSRVTIRPIKLKNIQDDSSVLYSKVIKKYLKPIPLKPEDEVKVKELERILFDGNETKLQKAKKIYYYIDEEIQRDPGLSKLSETLTLGRGSSRLKALLFTVLARRHGIPARMVLYVKLPAKGQPLKEKYFFLRSNEIFIGNRWIPLDTNNSYWGERPQNHLVFHHNVEEIENDFSKKKLDFSLKLQRVRSNKYNKAEYASEVNNSESFISLYSFYKLPLPVQFRFYQLLLIPLGTLVLCLARNIIGIPTFGIFTPILLTLFFNDTALAFGISFFALAILLGFFERNFLNRLFLLAVPRLSIILVLIVLLLAFFAQVSPLLPYSFRSDIGYFPLVVVTVFIERFSIMLTEEGVKHTITTLFGTMIISMLCYFMFRIQVLQIFVFTNPEILLSVIGLLILIGKYKGYRLSELIRFKNLLKEHKKKYV